MKKIKDSINLVPKEDKAEAQKDVKNKNVPNSPQKHISKEELEDWDEEENLYAENALELSGMTSKEKRAYKKQLHRKRMQTMDAKEKHSYILHYYKWYFIGGIVLIFLLYWLGNTIYTANLPTELIVAITNDGTNAVAEEYIPNAFRDYYDLDRKNIIQVFTNLTIDDADDVAIQQNTLTDYEKIIVYITSDKLDAIIGNETALNYYKSTGDIAIIDTCLDEKLYEEIEDHIVMAADESSYMNNGKPYAAAIDISKTEFAKNCSLSYDDVYLMIPNNRYSDNDATIRLIKLIFGL